MTEAEYQAQKPHIIQIIEEGITTEQQVCDFVAAE
jgi:hypothetical protein